MFQSSDFFRTFTIWLTCTSAFKMEALVRTMERMDHVILRHQKLPPAGAKRKQPEASPCPPPSRLLTVDQRCAEIKHRAMQLYEEAMKELDEVAKSLALSSADDDDEQQHDMCQD